MAILEDEKGFPSVPVEQFSNASDGSNGHGKPSIEHSEDTELSGERDGHIHPDRIDALSLEHRGYLLKRHGTLELDPVPGMGDADPYNWPAWKASNIYFQ